MNEEESVIKPCSQNSLSIYVALRVIIKWSFDAKYMYFINIKFDIRYKEIGLQWNKIENYYQLQRPLNK